MPSVCYSPACRFGALGRPASAPPGSMCCICECELNEDAELSGKARGALVKKVLSLRTDPDIFASAMSKLPLAVRSIIEQRVEALKAPQIDVPLADQGSKRKAAEVLNPMDQASFGLCSEYALATSVSSVLKLKYELCFPSEFILTTWLAAMVPSKALWPDAMGRSIGSFKLRSRSPDQIYEFTLREPKLITDYRKACHLTELMSGFAIIIVVAEVEKFNHSMTAARWLKGGDRNLLCLNSWGSHKMPFVQVTAQSFLRAYFVDVLDSWAWTPDGKFINGHDSFLKESSEWTYIVEHL